MKAINKRKKMWSLISLGAVAGFLLFSLIMPLFATPVLADETPTAAGATTGEAAKVEMSKDIYYKIPGPVSGPPVPKLTASDYPSYKLPYPLGESRIIVWFIAQQHLFFGSFVLAVPIFCMVIELVGMLMKDRVEGKRYDDLAHHFIKISLTAYSVTAILGGLLLFTFITLYPDFFRYIAGIFKPAMHIYALLFLAESGSLYIYYYGWDAMSEGFLKWVHASLGVLLNVF